jgi:hypothetical protein
MAREIDSRGVVEAEALRDRIVRLAGYRLDGVKDYRTPGELKEAGGPFYFLGTAIFNAALEVWVRKRLDYGDSRLYVKPDIPDFDVKMLFSDIHRKYLRLKEQVWTSLEPDEVYNTDRMLETLSDLMVYCMMGIIIAYEKEKQNATESTSNGS